jgi:hypothetical protein
MKESTIQQQICEYLSIHGIFFFAIQNENLMMMIKMFKVPERAGYALVSHSKKMGMVPGMPDLCVLLDTKSGHEEKIIFFEIKNENGTVSDRQRTIHNALYERGYDVYTARSISDVEKVLKKYEWRAYP